jgi:AcrR family transcriptional regulator
MSVPASGLNSPPASSRVVRRRNRKVADIVAAAAEVLAERGYHDTSLDEIADRLDIAKATLYHYFPSKESLVMACMEVVGTEVIQLLRDIASDESGTPRARLVGLIQLQLDIVVHRHPQIATLFRQPLDWPEAYRERIRELQRDHYAIFRSVVREGIESGQFIVEDEAVTMHNLFGAMNYVPVWFRPERKNDFAEMSQAVVDSLLRLFRPLGGSA